MPKYLVLAALMLLSCSGLAQEVNAAVATAAAGSSSAGDFLTMPPYQGNRSAGTFGSGTVNVLAVLPFYVEHALVVRSMKASVSTKGAVPDIFYYAGIYTTDGVLISWGRIPCGSDAQTGIVAAALSARVNLKRGLYLFASGSDDPNQAGTGAAFGQNYQFDTDMMNMLPGSGTAANTISNGTMPLSLGTVTEPYPYSAPFVVFY